MRIPTTVPLDEARNVAEPDFVDPLLEKLVYEKKKELVIASLSSCTRSERFVVASLMAGFPAEEIAKQRRVDPSRVSHHKRSAFNKIRAAICAQCPDLMASAN